MKKNKRSFHLVVAIIIGILLWALLPRAGGLTEKGARFLAILMSVVYLWIVEETEWCSYLCLAALAIFSVIDPTSVYLNAWGGNVVQRVVALSVLDSLMVRFGVFEYIAKWFISRSIVKGRPMVFYLLYSAAILLIEIASAPLLTCIMMFELTEAIIEQLGYTKKDKFYKGLILLTMWVAGMTDGMWPFTTPVPLAMLALFDSLGYHVSMVDYLKFSLPFGFVLILIGILVIKLVYRPDESRFAFYDDAGMRAQLAAKPLGREGKICLYAFVLIFFSWIAPSLPLGAVSKWCGSITGVTIPVLVIALLCVVTVDGKPVCDLKKELAQVPWTTVIFVGTVLLFATFVGKEEYGIVSAATALLRPVTELASPMIIVAIAGFIAMIATNFMSNTVSGVVTINVFTPALMAINGVDMGYCAAAAIAISCLSNCAYLTNAACPSTALCLAEDRIRLKEAFPYSVILLLFVWMAAVALVPLCAAFL